MSNQSLEREKAVDAAIDRAVREIMSAEPRPGFRQRVLRRLNEENAKNVEKVEPRAARWGVWPRVSLAAAALALLLIVFLWNRPVGRVPEGTVAGTEPPPRSAPPGIPQQELRPLAPTISPSRAGRVPALPTVTAEPRMVQAASIDADQVAQTVVQIESLQPPASLVVRMLESPEPSIPPIVVDAIAITDIAIAPLPSGGR